MKKEFLEHALKELQKSFSKIFIAEGLKKITPEILKEPEKALELACDHFILNQAFLPSPAQLLDRVKFEGRQLRLAQGDRIEAEEKKRKREEYEQGSVLTRRFKEPLGRDWQIFMAHILQGIGGEDKAKTWPELINECWELNAKYPGLNFDQLAKDWHQEFQESIHG